MIKMTLLTGKYAGQTRNVTNEDPAELFGSLLEHGWKWEVDYSQSTYEEELLWGAQDIGARAVRALMNDRTVTFMDKMYRGLDSAGDLEDAIVASGRMVTVGKDDASGLVIEVKGYAN